MGQFGYLLHLAPVGDFDGDLLFAGLLGGQRVDQSGDAVGERGLKLGAVFQALLERLMCVVDHVAGSVVIAVVELQALSIGHILGLPGESGELKHSLAGEKDGSLGADVGAGTGGNVAGPGGGDGADGSIAQPDCDGGIRMELTKELKEKLENAESKEEAKKILEEAGVELTDEEMDQVAGGSFGPGKIWLL